MRCILMGRASPDNGKLLRYEKLSNGIIVETWSYTYTETYVCVPDNVVKEIAKYYNTKPEELTDYTIAEYLIKVLDIEGMVEGIEHYFSMDW